MLVNNCINSIRLIISFFSIIIFLEKVYENFLKKKYKMEKYKKDINLPSLDKQIQGLRIKIRNQQLTQKVKDSNAHAITPHSLINYYTIF